MRLLLLQLSDIHIKAAGDWVLGRSRRIVDAVRDLDHTVDMCIVTLTGDVAYHGREDQYAVAERFVGDLTSGLRDALGPRATVHTVAIPGNHDCFLGSPYPARALLINGMQKDPAIAADPSTVATCLVAQEAFFAFRDRVAADGLVRDSRVYYEYVLPASNAAAEGEVADGPGAGETVLIRCLNTAWVSQNPETPGALLYPHNMIPVEAGGAAESTTRPAVVVSLLHHPYNWLEPMNGRSVRTVLQQVSDVILTGHEHATGIRQQVDEAGGRALYVEGLALQGHGSPPGSEFHAILVDTTERRQRVVSFAWKGARYEEERGPATAWAPFEENPRRTGHAFPVSDAMRRKLSDPGVTLSHPSRGALTLDDIFVYPDLAPVRYEPGAKNTRVVRGEEALQEAQKSGRLLITGADEAGKTTFAKRLFADALHAGYVPLLLDGFTVRLRGDERDRRELENLFEDQYAAKGSAYRDTPPEKRVILLDDFANMRSMERPSAEVLEYLTHFAGTVILFAHDVAQQVQEIAGLVPMAGGRTPFQHFRLLPVSHVRREEMIERYVALAPADSGESGEAMRADMRRILTVALGRYYAPPVPISVLIILQTRAFKDSLDLSHSTHGYYYELLIKRALLSNTTAQELDVRMAYLTALAYAVYRNGGGPWTEGWMMDFHQGFLKERRLNFKFGDAVSTLLDAGILSGTEDGFTFRYPYMYYYFVSRALAAELTNPATRDEIRTLTEHLDQEHAANILLFLTHHSKDAAIIDPMLEHADRLFADVARADLSRNSMNDAELDEAIQQAAYEDGPVAESRQRYLAARDDGERRFDEAVAEGVARRAAAPLARSDEDTAQRAERDAAVREAVGFVSRIYVALRTMQILGQLLKNFPGGLTGEQKERITQAVYGAALRTLGAVHTLMREHPEEHAQVLVEALRQAHPDLSTKQLVSEARTTRYWQIYQTALGITQRTAADVGNPMLDPVFEDIEAADPVPAIRLISMAIRLDRANAFPKKQIEDLYGELQNNPLALRVLRGLVVTHFHLFNVDHSIKQSICSTLDIAYTAPLPRSRLRLIAR